MAMVMRDGERGAVSWMLCCCCCCCCCAIWSLYFLGACGGMLTWDLYGDGFGWLYSWQEVVVVVEVVIAVSLIPDPLVFGVCWKWGGKMSQGSRSPPRSRKIRTERFSYRDAPYRRDFRGSRYPPDTHICGYLCYLFLKITHGHFYSE